MTTPFSLLRPVASHPYKFSLEVSMLSVKRIFIQRSFARLQWICYSRPSIYDEVAQDSGTFADLYDYRAAPRYQRVIYTL